MSPKNFEYFDVTADIGVKVWGSNIDELFEKAAMAVTSLMTDPNKIKKSVVREFFIEGNDFPSLLINWITELLIVRDSEEILFSFFKIKVSDDGRSLHGTCYGDYFDEHTLEMDIKAITYSLFKLERLNSHYYSQFVLDI